MNYYKTFFNSIKSSGECIKNYELVRTWFRKDNISKNDWDEFCSACLEEMMKDNKNILKKLKEKA
jgi:uncharacterized protein YeaO (DUF488 family)